MSHSHINLVNRHTMPAQQSMMLPGAMPELSRASSANSTPSSPAGSGQRYIPKLCDERLDHLEIGYWTSVPIGDNLASRVISLYLETDHPLLGLFEPRLFIRDLVGHRGGFCSQVLVNALLYWACVGFNSPTLNAYSFPKQYHHSKCMPP